MLITFPEKNNRRNTNALCLEFIGIDFVRKTFDVDGAKVQLEIWLVENEL